MDDEIREEDDSIENQDLADDKKKKDLIDDDVESLDDAADDELAVDKEDLMDDVEEM